MQVPPPAGHVSVRQMTHSCLKSGEQSMKDAMDDKYRSARGVMAGIVKMRAQLARLLVVHRWNMAFGAEIASCQKQSQAVLDMQRFCCKRRRNSGIIGDNKLDSDRDTVDSGDEATDFVEIDLIYAIDGMRSRYQLSEVKRFGRKFSMVGRFFETTFSIRSDGTCRFRNVQIKWPESVERNDVLAAMLKRGVALGKQVMYHDVDGLNVMFREFKRLFLLGQFLEVVRRLQEAEKSFGYKIERGDCHSVRIVFDEDLESLGCMKWTLTDDRIMVSSELPLCIPGRRDNRSSFLAFWFVEAAEVDVNERMTFIRDSMINTRNKRVQSLMTGSLSLREASDGMKASVSGGDVMSARGMKRIRALFNREFGREVCAWGGINELATSKHLCLHLSYSTDFYLRCRLDADRYDFMICPGSEDSTTDLEYAKMRIAQLQLQKDLKGMCFDVRHVDDRRFTVYLSGATTAVMSVKMSRGSCSLKFPKAIFGNNQIGTVTIYLPSTTCRYAAYIARVIKAVGNASDTAHHIRHVVRETDIMFSILDPAPTRIALTSLRYAGGSLWVVIPGKLVRPTLDICGIPTPKDHPGNQVASLIRDRLNIIQTLRRVFWPPDQWSLEYDSMFILIVIVFKKRMTIRVRCTTAQCILLAIPHFGESGQMRKVLSSCARVTSGGHCFFNVHIGDLYNVRDAIVRSAKESESSDVSWGK